MVRYFRRCSCTRFWPYNRFLMFTCNLRYLKPFRGLCWAGSALPSSVPVLWCSFGSSWLRWAELVQFEKSFAGIWYLSVRSFSSWIYLSRWYVLFTVFASYLSNESSAAVCLGWALWRHCLSGKLQLVCHCLLPNVSKCLSSNLSKELIWCLPGSPTIFLPNLSAEWCVLSELDPDYVCQIFLKRILLIVCLDWALWRHCLSGELQLVCFTVCCQMSPNVFLQICLRS